MVVGLVVYIKSSMFAKILKLINMKNVLLSVAALFSGIVLLSSCAAPGCRVCSMSVIEITACPDGTVKTCFSGNCSTVDNGVEGTTEGLNDWANAMQTGGYNCN